MALFALYGLVFDTELPLPGRPLSAVPRGQLPIKVIEEHGATLTEPQGPGVALADSGSGSLVWREPDGVHFRIGRLCEAIFPPAGDALRVRVADANPSLVVTLVAGAYAALALSLRGDWPLHASAVSLDRKAVAIVGASGMGKTTWAGALCWSGAKLITDDVLVVDLHEGVPVCRTGSSVLRFRQVPSGLDGLQTTPSGDGRFLWQPEAALAPTPLAGILVPRLTDEAEPRLERIDQAGTVRRLSQFPRILGWRTPDMRARQFRQLSQLARLVPAYEVSLKRGSSFRDLAHILPSLAAQTIC